MNKRLLACADLGGTNSRFALFEVENSLELLSEQWLATSAFSDTQSILGAFTNCFGFDLADLSGLVIAMAGPVSGHRGCLANACLELDLEKANLPCPSRLINDFEAQAWACLGPCGINAPLIAGPSCEASGTKAVLGAGTGLGVASLIPQGNTWLALPSEGGHMAFPFIGKVETDFQNFLCSRLNLLFGRGDDTITGRGLVLLHEFLTGESLSPAEVGQKALNHDCPTLEWYSRFYARACRNWMLATLCTGGLWIAGGIAAKNPFCVRNKHFIAELYNSPEDYLRNIPVRLIEEKNSGLWGAAYLANMICDKN